MQILYQYFVKVKTFKTVIYSFLQFLGRFYKVFSSIFTDQVV